jgi:starch phosphorylase
MKTIAYFAAEYAVADDLPTYAGGLGVLAGDIVRQAGDDARDFIAIGAAYRHNVAMKRQGQDSLETELRGDGFAPLEGPNGKPLVVNVDFGDWSVDVGAWEKRFGKTRLWFIDTNLGENKPIDRNLTANLYDPDLRTRLLQQFVMADAALQMFERLGIKPDIFHMNEGHMAFVGTVLALHHAGHQPGTRLDAALEEVKDRLVGSKHTILAGAGDFADRGTIVDLFDGYCQRFGRSGEELFKLGVKDGEPQTFSTTALLVRSIVRGSAVSALHAEAEKHDHATSQLIAITNGVHQPTWQRPALAPAERGSDPAELWRRHEAERRALVSYTNAQLGSTLSEDRLTVVWARRFASYKRPLLIFSDFQRLAQILSSADHPIQLIVSGNANESDAEGMRVLEAVTAMSQNAELHGYFAYLPHYATDTTKVLAAGADLWLNTPIRGYEACGTSGMKAGLNGAVHLSTSDGWIDEVEIGKIGWELPVENSDAALYDLLEHEVAPLFYDRDKAGIPQGWVEKMQASIDVVEQKYVARVMMQNYYDKLYT